MLASEHMLYFSVGHMEKFKLVNTCEASTSEQPAETNWELCVICLEETAEFLYFQKGKTLERDTNHLLTTWPNLMNWESCQELCS